MSWKLIILFFFFLFDDENFLEKIMENFPEKGEEKEFIGICDFRD
jgi:predicted PurR-regulated permease PerM